jgi:hypothetical protein
MIREGRSMLRLLLSACAVWFTLTVATAGAADDVGLVNQIAGEVQYRPAGGTATRASAFMKVREGDAFKLAAGARLRLTYFDGGRQETWDGPADLTAGRGQGKGSGKMTAAQLPGAAPQALAQTPELMQIVRVGRPGAVTVRGVKPGPSAEQNAAVAKAEETYKAWAAGAAADDITPELYLLNVLQQHGRREAMRPVVERMKAKAPAAPEVAEIAQWLGNQNNAGGKP